MSGKGTRRSAGGKGPRRSARGKGGGATGRTDGASSAGRRSSSRTVRPTHKAKALEAEFKFLSKNGAIGSASKSATRSTGSKNSGGKSSSVDQGRNKESKGGRNNKENISPARTITRSRSKANKEMKGDRNNKENISPARTTTRSRSKATTKAKPAAGIAKAGDIISISRDDGTKVTKERAEVLEIDMQTGMANLWYDDTAKEETAVKLSDLVYTVEDKYVEPVPQHQDLPDFSDVAPGAPKHKPDDPQVLLELMSGRLSLKPYDEDLLKS